MALKKKSTFFCFLGEFATFLGKYAYFLQDVTKCNVATTVASIGCKLFGKTFFLKKKFFLVILELSQDKKVPKKHNSACQKCLTIL